MYLNYPRDLRLLLAIPMATATIGMAEVSSGKMLPVKITPEMIHQVARQEQLEQPALRARPPLIRKENNSIDIFRGSPRNLERLPNACGQNSGSLCFDYRSGRTVYKPMRKLLPEIPGMTAHNLSLRRNKIVAQYTFK